MRAGGKVYENAATGYSPPLMRSARLAGQVLSAETFEATPFCLRALPTETPNHG